MDRNTQTVLDLQQRQAACFGDVRTYNCNDWHKFSDVLQRLPQIIVRFVVFLTGAAAREGPSLGQPHALGLRRERQERERLRLDPGLRRGRVRVPRQPAQRRPARGPAPCAPPTVLKTARNRRLVRGSKRPRRAGGGVPRSPARTASDDWGGRRALEASRKDRAGRDGPGRVVPCLGRTGEAGALRRARSRTASAEPERDGAKSRAVGTCSRSRNTMARNRAESERAGTGTGHARAAGAGRGSRARVAGGGSRVALSLSPSLKWLVAETSSPPRPSTLFYYSYHCPGDPGQAAAHELPQGPRKRGPVGGRVLGRQVSGAERDDIKVIRW